ncbi:hypothetical protein Tco_1498550 [Tanacetum coccineum]
MSCSGFRKGGMISLGWVTGLQLLEKKQRIRSQLKGESSKGPDNGGKRSKNDAGKPVKQVGDAETANPKSETEIEGEKKQSRKQRKTIDGAHKKKINGYKRSPPQDLEARNLTSNSVPNR